MTNIVDKATRVSLGIQLITGLFGLFGLTIPLKSKDLILKQVLGLELLVQFIEFIFYVGFLSISNIKNLTIIRYYDWFISTPVMLFTISLYFYYVNFIENTKDGKTMAILEFIKNNLKEIIWIVLLNFLMLLFGFLAELGIINNFFGFTLGTASLIGSFSIIYNNYAKYSNKTKNIFWIMFSLWSLYGVSFLLPYISKNIGYTILDVFSKNFFGIFLSYIIFTKRI